MFLIVTGCISYIRSRFERFDQTLFFDAFNISVVIVNKNIVERISIYVGLVSLLNKILFDSIFFKSV